MNSLRSAPWARPRRWPARAACALSVAAVGGCATAGSTLGSGVGDAFLEHPPYYAGSDVEAGTAVRTGHLPVAYQRGASQPAVFDPSLEGPVAELLERMTAYLDSLGVTSPLAEGGRVSAVGHAATRGGPDVRFGCVTESGFPDDECADREGALGRGDQAMQLAVGRPSAEWTAWMAQVMEDAGVDRALVVTLEVGQYLTRQEGWRGTKEVELGTGRVERLPWLTSLETPVSVLQLTGAVMGRDGKAVRIGAEGLLARRTDLKLSAIGAQELITDEDVERLLTERRDDVPGAPLVWEAALRNLVTGLLGGT